MTIKLKLLFFALTLSLLFGFIFKAPLLSVKEIQISSNSAKIESKMHEKLDYLKKKNSLCLFLFNAYYSSQIKEQFLAIERVNISVNFPSRIHIHFDLKAPFYLFITKKHSVVTSQDGSPLKTLFFNPIKENIKHLFIIKNVSETQITKPFIQQLNQITESILFHLPQVNLQLHIPTLDQIVLIKDDTLPIKIGSPKDIDLKLISLKAFLTHYKKPQSLEYIDLRLKHKVIAKPLTKSFYHSEKNYLSF